MTEYEFGWVVFIGICVVITWTWVIADLIADARKNKKKK